jgi:hypothetical protein
VTCSLSRHLTETTFDHLQQNKKYLSALKSMFRPCVIVALADIITPTVIYYRVPGSRCLLGIVDCILMF